MEILLLVVLLVIILIIRATISDNNSVMRDMRHTLNSLHDEVRELNKKIEEQKIGSASLKTGTAIEPDVVKPAAPPSTFEKITPQEPVIEIPVYRPSPVPPVEKREQLAEPVVFQQPISEPVNEGWFDKWLKNNPDLEKFIGENLINKIGIAVLVLGIAFFVKYAIDQNWINETGRVGIGFLCGGILTGLAHRLRNSYRSFSSVLVGGGLTVFYFTIAFAFHEYHLIGQSLSFISMVVITAFAVILSVLYSRLELAILATIGGFITPFLVSTGSNNYIALFTYLAILNAGLIVLAYFKHWRPLNFISLFFTLVIYGTWFANLAFDHALPYKDAFLFATIFYFLFVAMNLISQFSVADNLKAFDFSMLLAINICFYSAGMIIFHQAGWTGYKGLFTASLGVFNLVLAYVLFRNRSLDKNFIYLLVGLTITYISLTAPVQLKGNHITLFWAAEAVLLLWFYQRTFIKLAKQASLLVTICMVVSLVIDWFQVYGPAVIIPVVINKAFITTLFSAISCFVSYLLLRKEADTFYLRGITNQSVRLFYSSLSIVFLLIIGTVETNHQFITRYPGAGLNFVYIQLYVVSFFVLLFTVLPAIKWKLDDYLKTFITVVVFFLYLVNSSNVYTEEIRILASGQNTIHLLAWMFNAVAVISFLGISFFYLVRNKKAYKATFPIFINMLSLAFITVTCMEVRNAYIWSTFNVATSLTYYENLYTKAFLTIILSLSSFIMIWLGMKYRFKSLRITALVLFGITLLKLFSFDIQNIPPAGKIAAFILLGILLLVVSFMYQRLKKLLIDNAPSSE